jgi:hypothetical protein
MTATVTRGGPEAGKTAGPGAPTGPPAGVAVLALAMAAGCAWRLSRRLAGYR